MKLAVWALLVYGLYCLVLFLFQRTLMFPRYLLEAGAGPPADAGIVVEWVDAGFGPVESWFLPPAGRWTAPAPAVIVAHGNGELIDFLPAEFAPLRQMGVGVMLVEYPGYGRSGGSPSQERISQIFQAAYDRLCRRPGVDANRIAFFGRSLGGGAVCELSRHRRAGALILVSTFTSARSFARRYLAPGVLVRDPFDNLSALKAFSGPVLLVHGRHDDVVGFHHAQTLLQAGSHVRLIALDCGHNDCPPDPQEFWRRIADFLIQAGMLPRTAADPKPAGVDNVRVDSVQEIKGRMSEVREGLNTDDR